MLGQRENGTERLEEAVHAFRLTLEEWTLTQAPFDWAATQSNLGYAQTLGQRKSRNRTTKRLPPTAWFLMKDSLDPLDWARTQKNLANTLQVLGERENGTRRLEEAVEAYGWLSRNGSGGIRSDWARFRTILVLRFGCLGRENSTERLEEAVVAFQLAWKSTP